MLRRARFLSPEGAFWPILRIYKLPQNIPGGRCRKAAALLFLDIGRLSGGWMLKASSIAAPDYSKDVIKGSFENNLDISACP